MDNGNNFFKKNWLTLILIALLGGVSIMWIKNMNETKAKEEAAVEKADSGAVASQEAVDSLAGTMAKEDSIPQETADPLKDEPVVRLRPSLIKGPACMVANTFESYYPRNVIDGKLAAYIGTKEGIKEGDKFDVFEAVVSEKDPNMTDWKPVGKIKVAKKGLWDNSEGAGQPIEGRAYDKKEEQAGNSSLKCTFFEGKVGKLGEGNLIRLAGK